MENTLLEAADFFVKIFGAYIVFTFAKGLARRTDSTPFKAYFMAIVVSLVFALFGWARYGTHTEDSGDQLFSGVSTTVQDFTPTKQERNQQGLYMFLIVCGVSLIGVHCGLKARSRDQMTQHPKQ